jgi:hypothetical protein
MIRRPPGPINAAPVIGPVARRRQPLRDVGALWYVSPMELLILILVVLAIVALLVYILRGRRR